MKCTPRFKAVIFDLDGTLLDTIGDITRVVNAGLADFGLPARTSEECRRFVGEGLNVLVKRALPDASNDPGLFAKVLKAVKRAYISQPVNTTILYPGIDYLLDQITDKGIPMAILTNKPDDLAQLSAGTLLARWKFACVLGERQGNAPKPGKEAATQLAGIMNSCPSDTVVIGDSEIDILTARNAGMFSAAVSWGLRNRQDLESISPDLIVDKPEELLELFK